MADCIFCRIVAGEMPSDKVYEDDEFLAFNDISPKAPVHVLLITKRHYRDLVEMEREGAGALMGRLLERAARVAAELGVDKSGFRLINNCGPDGGQEVDHVHFHILGGTRIGAPLA